MDIYRTPDLRLQQSFPFPQAIKLVETAFSSDGSTLAIGEQTRLIHFYRVTGWQKIHALPFEGNLWCLAFRPDGVIRQPVVFVHGHSVPAGPVWFESSGNSSFADMLKLHPDIPVNAVFLYLPGNGDLVVGGATPSLDCMGRRQARMHAPDVHNRELNSLPGPSHEHFVHDPIVICTVLKVLRSHAMPPESNQVCSNIKRKKA